MMERKPEDLLGMTAAEGKEYIFQYLSTLKLTEKELESLAGDHAKWTSRVTLAEAEGKADLAAAARKEAARIQVRMETLGEEAETLRAQIDRMRRQLPALAARERSVDPDYLEQELQLLLGKTPGEEDSAQQEKQFSALEAEAAADAALEALKAKMGRGKAETDDPGTGR